jgi:hypothetical protein
LAAKKLGDLFDNLTFKMSMPDARPASLKNMQSEPELVNQFRNLNSAALESVKTAGYFSQHPEIDQLLASRLRSKTSMHASLQMRTHRLSHFPAMIVSI